MNVSIIGSGNMANAIGARIAKGNHSLTIYDRNLGNAQALASSLGADVQAQELTDAITGDVVIFALPYQVILEMVEKYSDQLAGKIIVDISNPLNYQTFDFIPPADSSGAEEIEKLLPPGANLVKAFNTVFAGPLLAGEVDGKKLDIYIASDDTLAADAIVKLTRDGGLRGLYVGPLKRARYLEGMQLIQMSLQEKLETNWMSAIKILP